MSLLSYASKRTLTSFFAKNKIFTTSRMYNSYLNLSKENNASKPRYRFYHLPKNGGTAIFNMTGPWARHKRAHPNRNHVRLRDYPPKEDETAYAVIRHPYSRFESAFYHLVDACDDSFYYKNATVSDCDWLEKKKISMTLFNNDPNEFLKAMQEKIHPYHRVAQAVWHHFDILKPQLYWVADSSRRAIDSRIKMFLRQENLEREFQKIADSLGEYAMWPRGRSANTRLTRRTIPLNDQSKAILRTLYKDDFRHWSFEH